MNEQFLANIARTERIASASKLQRLLYNPFKYLFAVLFWKLIYQWMQKPLRVNAMLFFGKRMRIALPAATCNGFIATAVYKYQFIHTS
jgi:hypothetical protein